MFLISSERLNVYLKQDQDYKNDLIYTVIYGLQVKQFNNLGDAISNYNDCLDHSIKCEGL